MFQVPYIFPYSKINHSRTTEVYYENGIVEVLRSPSSGLTPIKTEYLKRKVCFCESRETGNRDALFICVLVHKSVHIERLISK